MRRPVFVLSTGRCGTLALQRFLKHSETVEAFHRYRGFKSEYRNDMSFVLEQNYAYYHALKDDDAAARRLCRFLLRRSRSYLIRRVAKRGKALVELNHEFTPYGPLLAEAFPDAKFVHLFRGSRSVVTSFMQKFDPLPMSLPAYMGTRLSPLGQYVLRYGYAEAVASRSPEPIRRLVRAKRFDTQLHPFEKTNGRWAEPGELSTFEKTCWYWNAVNRVAMDLLDQLDDDRKLSIKFEDFFDPDTTDDKKRLLDFMEIGDVSDTAIRESFAKPVNVKEKHTSFPNARDWDDAMRETLERHCAETAKALGY